MKLAPRYDGPPIISIEGRPDDQLAPATRQRRRLERTLATLSGDDWHVPSRCDGWSVQDVVAHLVGVNTFWAASVRAGAAGTPTRILSGFDPAATPPLLIAPMRTLTATEVLDQFVQSNDDFLGAVAELDDASWSLVAEAPPGHIPIRLLVHHALWDSWIHERDIALPLGLTHPVEADEVASSLRYVAALAPALALLSATACTGTFAVHTTDPEVCFELDVTESATVRNESTVGDAPCLRGDAVELLEAMSLRVPLPRAAPDEWRAVLDGLATAFGSDSGTEIRRRI